MLNGEQIANFAPMGNEANFCTGFSEQNGYFYFNYRNATSPIKAYRFCDGQRNTIIQLDKAGLHTI